MRKRVILIMTILNCFALAATAQTVDIPSQYSFRNKEDYSRYEKEALAVSQWLFTVSPKNETDKRRQATAFLQQWLEGNPFVKAEPINIINSFEEKNPGMSVLYQAGCIRYVLENNYSKDIRAKQKATLLWMMDYYDNMKGIKRDKLMKTLIKENKKGRLEEWINSNMTVTG